MANQNFPVIPELRVKTDVLSTDATVKLASIQWYVGSDGVAVNLSSASFGTSGSAWGVFEPRTSRQEFFKWTTSTIANGTTTGITISARGLPWGGDYATEDSTRKFAHPAGSKVLLFTDYGGFWNTFANKGNTETITAVWTYSATPVISNAPSGSTDAANKGYVDGVAVAGAPNADTSTKGIVEIATGAELAAGTGTGGTGAILVSAGSSFKNTSAGAGDANKVPVLNASGVLDTSFLPDPLSRTANQLQITTDADSADDAVRQSYLKSTVNLFGVDLTSGEAINANEWVYVKASDGKVYKTDADSDEPTYSVIGISLSTVAGADQTVRIARAGAVVTGLSGLTAGNYYYLSGTAGAIANTPHATRIAKVAQALSSTSLRVIEPKFIRSGSQTITSATTFTQTTGFYPSRVILFAAPTAGGVAGLSVGDDTNKCMAHYAGVGGTVADYAVYRNSEAWYCFANNGPTNKNSGTVSAKSQTDFTLNCGTYVADAEVMWTAYSE